MSIPIEDARKHAGSPETELLILRFMGEHKSEACSRDSIMEALGYLPPVRDEKASPWIAWNWQNVRLFAVSVAEIIAFDTKLERLVEQGKIKESEIEGKKYFYLP